MKKYLGYISLLLLITVFNSCGALYCDIIHSGPSKYCDNFYHKENEKGRSTGGKGTYTSEEELRRKRREDDELIRRLEEMKKQNQNKK